MAFVLDSSVAMSWCFEDETTPYTERVLELLTHSQAVAPAVWPIEISNVLLVAEHRGRITTARSTRFLRLLEDLPISIDSSMSQLSPSGPLELGRAYNLSAYDASYLELAMREQMPLATLDVHLREAAAKSGVELVK